MQNINLVLSGGAVKAIAHMALIKRLEDLGVKISGISGVSAGGIIAACCANKMNEREIIQFFKDAPLFKISYLTANKPGLFDSDKYRNFLSEHLPQNFKDLSIPIHLAVVNLCKSKMEYLDSGDLIEALTCTCALPPIFSPIMIKDQMYADGGVMDNFPIEPFAKSKKILVGSYVCTPGNKSTDELNSMLKVSNHSSALLVHSANQSKFKDINLLVDFPLQKFGSFKTSEVEEIYKAAKLHLNAIQNPIETLLGA